MSTLIVSVLGIVLGGIIYYYWYQKKKREANHASKLIEFIQKWQSYLPEIPLTEQTKNTGSIDGFDTSFVKNIETLYYFKDFFHHYSDFEKEWKEFKLLSNKYCSGKQELYNLIKEKVRQELISQNFNAESKIEDGFCVSIFRDIIIEANGKVSGYKHFHNDVISGGIKKYQVKYCNVFKGGNPDDRNHYLIATTNEFEKIEKIHKGLIKDCIAQYVDKSKEIIGMENKLRKGKDKLNLSLETICQKPFSIPKMDCEFVKGRK